MDISSSLWKDNRKKPQIMRKLWNNSSCCNITIHFWIPEAAHTAIWKFNVQEP